MSATAASRFPGVFQLGGSAISSAETATQLEAALLAQWPTFVSYAISFLVVGLY
jgi:hypothetical protein